MKILEAELKNFGNFVDEKLTFHDGINVIWAKNGAGKSTLLKIIVGELAADSGEVVLAKGKTLGYLAQHQDLDSSRTIYEELKEVKQPIIDMEQQIRELEVNMQNASGEDLEQMLSTYSRLSHTFEL